MDREALKAAVRAAFATVPAPATQNIAPHASTCCGECTEIQDAFGGRAQELDDALLARHIWDLPLLSDEAKQFFLPAWLVRAIDDPRSDAAEAVLFALQSDHRWQPAGGYSEPQRHVLAAFLELLIDHLPDDEQDDYQLDLATERWARPLT